MSATFGEVGKSQFFKVGDDKYDISLEITRTNNFFAQKIKSIETDEIPHFFEHQLKDNPYQITLLLYIHESIVMADYVDDSVKNDLFAWLNTKSGLSINYRRKAIRLFQEMQSAAKTNMDKWRTSLSDFTDILSSEDCLEFLKFGLQKLQEGEAIHKKICEKPNRCTVNESYEFRILFLQKLVSELEQELTSDSTTVATSYDRIEWKGTQKQLAELFIELKRKGWIEEHNNYDAIKACFTKSNSIQQVLKPAQDKKTKEPTYEGVYTADYKAKFYAIKENPKRDK